VFVRSEDQELFEDTTERFLDTECPLDTLRELSAQSSGYARGFWQQGAELGWTSMLVPSELGGGSVSDRGVLDLALVAYQFGLHAAPGPLVGSNVVAAALGRWGTIAHQAGPLQQLLSGEATGAWALAETPPHGSLGRIEMMTTETADGFVLHGTKAPVEAGQEATYLLVTARTGSGLSQFLVPSDASGVEHSPLESLDITKGFARVRFDGVRVPRSALVGQVGGAADAVSWLTDLAVTVLVAEMCGAMRWALDTTLEWAVNRYSFGRPLASYQEVKHRFADMKMWLEASHAITTAAADAVDRDEPNRSELVSAAKFYVGRYGTELVQDCVQLHGGIGLTFDHHLHLFLRRITTNTPLFGTPGEHAARLTDLFEARRGAA
jgi:alkylation response protein AidB-like acyl-CoA dehydrogenase